MHGYPPLSLAVQLPSVSVAIAYDVTPATTLAAAPALEPPEVLLVFHGWRLTPVSGEPLPGLQPNALIVVAPYDVSARLPEPFDKPGNLAGNIVHSRQGTACEPDARQGKVVLDRRRHTGEPWKRLLTRNQFAHASRCLQNPPTSQYLSGAVDQRILPALALQVALYLIRHGWAYVVACPSCQMLGGDLVRRPPADVSPGPLIASTAPSGAPPRLEAMAATPGTETRGRPRTRSFVPTGVVASGSPDQFTQHVPALQIRHSRNAEVQRRRDPEHWLHLRHAFHGHVVHRL